MPALATLGTAALFFCVLLSSANSSAASNPDDVYLIEMVAFVDGRATGRDAASNLPGSEQWRNPEQLSYPERLKFLRGNDSQRIELAAQSEAGDTAVPFMQLLRVSDSAIAEIANKLRTRSAFRVVFEGSWLQELTDRERAPAVPIVGGKRFSPWYELMGSVTFSKERYLHITTDLWFSEFVDRGSYAPDEPWYVSQASEIPLPSPPGISEGGAARSDYRAARTYTLREFRRLKRGQLNYLDHPVFGAIVKVSRYRPNQAAQTAAP
ncbi:MAG: hypothetical protein HKO07_00580 [Pseudomonadales bacterium]|nr:hypothetical protein [Pseudomonadales bacterium]